jgi:molecular chaperone HtpG
MTTVLEKGNISIHTENIFPIIKKWLYSDHEIFLRELVSNAVDAIQKLKMVSYSGELAGDVGEPEVVITIDKAQKTLAVSDTGIGMTADEVKQYINQVAFSSAESFVEKYKAAGDQQIIGHFGLGFTRLSWWRNGLILIPFPISRMPNLCIGHVMALLNLN